MRVVSPPYPIPFPYRDGCEGVEGPAPSTVQACLLNLLALGIAHLTLLFRNRDGLKHCGGTHGRGGRGKLLVQAGPLGFLHILRPFPRPQHSRGQHRRGRGPGKASPL